MSNYDKTGQELYKDVIKDHISPALRKLGFKGSNGKYAFPSEENWLQVGFQKSFGNTVEEVRFTVNLHVTNRKLWHEGSLVYSWLPEQPSPNTTSMVESNRTRLGHIPFAQERSRAYPLQDTWWTVKSFQSYDEAVDDVLERIEFAGLPWLKSHEVS